jgi:hypothetical protein
MRLEPINPAREFRVGRITLRHALNLELDPDEQVTLTTPSGTEYDIVRKSWGYYATTSLNRRLVAHGLRAALCANSDRRLALLLVEDGHEPEFEQYLAEQEMRVLALLDSDEAAATLLDLLEGA